MSRIFTIGHSTRSIGEFLEMLRAHNIALVADVRSFPMSRRYPHFNKDELSASLSHADIRYEGILNLGGRRKTSPRSPNGAWRNASFRGYADHMQTDEFKEGLSRLEALGHEEQTAFMCSEAVPWRCHRSLIADALVARGWSVMDIFDARTLKPHALNSMARVEDTVVTYPPRQEPLM